MRKVRIILMAIVLFVMIAGTAFAETPLHSSVDKLLGTKYAWGGTSEKGFDCSGFTQYVFAQFDIELPRSSRDQAKKGTAIKKSDLRPGDLVFFNTSGKGISHVGIYLGDGEFAHSASNKGVVINKMNEKYYTQRYVTARRVLSDEQYQTLAVETVEEQLEEAAGEPNTQ